MKRLPCLLLVIALLSTLLTGCDQIASLLNGIFPDMSELPTSASIPSNTITEPPTEIPDTAESLLFQALRNEHPVLNEFDRESTLSNYLYDYFYAVATAYTLVDFNEDGQMEMVVLTDNSYTNHIVLHADGQTVSACSFDYWEMQDLKADGSFIVSSEAGKTAYCRLRFQYGRCITWDIASVDYQADSFLINGESSTAAAMTDFIAQWQSKTSAIWTWLDVHVEEPEPTAPPTPTGAVPYILAIPSASQPIYAGPGYGYNYVQTVELAGYYTITEESWDDNGHLWGKLKSGVGWVDLTDIYSQ